MSRYLGIFSNATAIQTALDSNELEKPYIVLNTANNLINIDYNTLSKTPVQPIILGTQEHPVEAYENRYTYYYKTSYTLSENYEFAANEGSGPLEHSGYSAHTLNKTTNVLYDICAYNGTGSGGLDHWRAGLYITNGNAWNDFIYVSENDSYYSILLSSNPTNQEDFQTNDYDNLPSMNIDPVIHQ